MNGEAETEPTDAELVAEYLATVGWSSITVNVGQLRDEWRFYHGKS